MIEVTLTSHLDSEFLKSGLLIPRIWQQESTEISLTSLLSSLQFTV